MQRDWIAFEYYRLEVVQQWRDSSYNEATLNAIRSSLASLMSDPSVATGLSECVPYGISMRVSRIFEFPTTSRTSGTDELSSLTIDFGTTLVLRTNSRLGIWRVPFVSEVLNGAQRTGPSTRMPF